MEETTAMANGFMMGSECKNGNNGGFGNGIWDFLLAALIFGGYGGFGGFGGFGGGYGLQGMVTRADINEGFALNNITGGIRGLERGLCDGFYGVQNGLNTIGHQISDCCCATQRAIDGVNYNLATQICGLQNTMNTNTRDIIDATNSGTRAVLDFLVQDKLADKDAQIAALTNQLSQATNQLSQVNQNSVLGARIDAAVAEVLRRTGHDCPTAAYLVNAPTPVNFPVNSCGQVQFTNNGGCGCGYGY